MRRRNRSLRSRLFSAFVGAIVIAMAMSALVIYTTRPEPVVGAEAMAHNVSDRLAQLWDDPAGTQAFLSELHDVTGFDVRLVRDPRRLPVRVQVVVGRGGAIVPDGLQHIFVPVVVDGTLVGALEMDRFGPRVVPGGWWRFGLALFLVVALLSAMAGGVANQLAVPLERLARAADRLGEGDLAFRTDVASRGRRWVAREVRDVALRFNRMADRLEAMVRGQRELLGAISHELRSPLARARIALEIARDRLPAPTHETEPLDQGARPTSAALDELEKQLGAVDAILGDLLDAARSGLSDLRKETRSLSDWLRTRVAEEPEVPELRVAIAPEPANYVLAFDPALLGRALQNLFVNARAHGHPVDRPIDVGLTRTGDVVRLVVRDRGSGFPEGFAERAFEPFVRGDAARARPTVGAGYGLGLAIVRRIVEAHGGRVFAANVTAVTAVTGVSAETSPDAERAQGAEVGFELPAAPPTR